MNPLQLIGMFLPIIEQLPTVTGGVTALWSAISKMAQSGFSPGEVFGAVEQSLPAITQAITANTPAASEPAPAAPAQPTLTPTPAK